MRGGGRRREEDLRAVTGPAVGSRTPSALTAEDFIPIHGIMPFTSLWSRMSIWSGQADSQVAWQGEYKRQYKY